MAYNYTTRLKYLYKIGSCIQADLFPDGVGVAPLALPAPPPEATLEHPGVGLEVVVANFEVTKSGDGRESSIGRRDLKLNGVRNGPARLP